MHDKPEIKSHGKVIASYTFFLFIFLVAFAIRFNYLKKPSFWSDEICQISCTRGTLAEIWKKCPKDKPPLDYFLQWFFVRTRSDEVRTRLHACILGSAAVVVLGLWAKAIGGWILCLITLSLVLANPLMVHYSAEGRPYALMLFAECLFFANFWSIVRAPKPVSPFRWAFLSFSIFLCLWSLYFAWGVVILTLLFAGILRFFQRDKGPYFVNKGKVFIPAFFLVIPFLLSLPLFPRALAAGMEDFYFPFEDSMVSGSFVYLNMMVLGYNWMKFIHGAGWIWLFLGLIGFAGWALRRDKAWIAGFCAFMFTSLFFGIFYFYKLIDHWMSLRYLLIAIPPLVILVAMGIERIAALVSLLTARSSHRLGRSLSLFTIVLLCLGNLATAWSFIIKNEFPRPPWREFAQRLRSMATDKSVVVVGDLGDCLVLKHYFDIYAIPAQISMCDYKSQTIRETLENNQDVWVALPMRNISPEINRELTGMYREFPEFPLLDVRRSLLHFISVERKRKLLEHAVSLENPLVPVVMGENDDLFLGIGFDRLERWDQTVVRALDGSRAEFFLPLDRPFPLFISLSFFPYRPDDQPPLSIALKANGNLISEKKVINGWNCITWEIDRQRLHKGINRIEIIPNRTLHQVRDDNNSKDSRILSIWIEKILAEIREGG